MFQFTATPPLSLYIHIPWCVRKCPYCDFNSHEPGEGIPQEAYLEALIADLEQDLPKVWGRTVETVFIGGGTPSLFSPAGIDRLLNAVRARLPLKPGAEITLEANPGTVDRERFHGFREAGINRLSLGIQSFQPERLQAIGRIHDGSEAVMAIEAARAAGFDNINLDLMFGLPGQDIAQALDDLQTATGFGPAHLSWYELTIEPNTWFHRHPPARAGDELLWDMQQAGHTLLAGQGYTGYEVSAFAREGRRCRHNVNYWEFGDYLGIGAGAHGKLTDATAQTVCRSAKTRHPRAYIEATQTDRRPGSTVRLSAGDVLLEFCMNALRLEDGFSQGTFASNTGLPATAMLAACETAAADGLLETRNDRVRCTGRGRRYLNDVLQHFMPVTGDDARAG
jgi:oxygen-independent coproporphyrinogen-3 oxidase